MDNRLVFLLLLLSGILLLIFSIIFRKKKRLRIVLLALGLLMGVLPILSFMALRTIGFIQERSFVGTYKMHSELSGTIELQILHDNTFQMRSDSCSMGFVQGDWKYVWRWNAPYLDFVSTSQKVGHATFQRDSTLSFRNVPVCVRLIPELNFQRISETTTLRDEKFSY